MSTARSFLTVGECGVESLTAEQVQKRLIEAMGDDQMLSDCLSLIEQDRPDLGSLVDDTVEGIMYFCEDSACRALKLRCRLAVRRTEKERSYTALEKASSGAWDGFELKNKGGTQFAILGQDASEPGRVRATLFDATGFSGHRTRDGYQPLVRELISEGYVLPAPGALHQLSATESFREGNAALARIDRMKRELAAVD